MREMRDDMRSLDDRPRDVEIAFGKVDQRLATLERLHLPTPDRPTNEPTPASTASASRFVDEDLG